MQHCLPANRKSLALRLDPVRRRSRVRKGWKTPQRRADRALAAAVELLCKDRSEELIDGRVPHQPLSALKGRATKPLASKSPLSAEGAIQRGAFLLLRGCETRERNAEERHRESGAWTQGS